MEWTHYVVHWLSHAQAQLFLELAWHMVIILIRQWIILSLQFLEVYHLGFRLDASMFDPPNKYA